MSTNGPINKFRHKGITVTLWRAKNNGISYQIKKEFKAKGEAEWKKTDTFFGEELDQLIRLITEAKRFVDGMNKDEQHSEEKGNAYQPEPNELYASSGLNDDDIPF